MRTADTSRTPASHLRRLLLVLAAGAIAATAAWSADQTVRVFVNGRQNGFEPQARLHEGLAYAPLRPAANAVGAKISWNEKGQMAIICLGTQCVPVKASKGIMVDNHLLVPLRVMAEALKCKVNWNPKDRAVVIETAAYAHAHPAAKKVASSKGAPASKGGEGNKAPQEGHG